LRVAPSVADGRVRLMLAAQWIEESVVAEICHGQGCPSPHGVRYEKYRCRVMISLAWK